MNHSLKFSIFFASIFSLFLFYSLSCIEKRSTFIHSFGVQFKVEQKKLKNGLNVIFIENHDTPLISYQTWFKVGSVDEMLGITGVSHLIEHLMFKGTKKFQSHSFFESLEAYGSNINSATNRDYSVFCQTFVSKPKLLEKVIEMEADRMSNMIVQEEKLNIQRFLTLEERRLRAELSPESQMEEALWQVSFQRHPYQWSTLGYLEDILSLKLSQVETYFKSYYHPANATLIIAGDFSIKKTWDLINKYYGSTTSNQESLKKRLRIPEEPKQNEERRYTLRGIIKSERFAHAYHITAADKKDSQVLDLLASIFFDGRSSLGYHELVEEAEILTELTGTAYTPLFPGLFIITGKMVEGVSIQRAEKALDKFFSNLQENLIDSKEVSKAAKRISLQFAENFKTMNSLGQLIGIAQMIVGDYKNSFNDLEEYSKITPFDIKRVANTYFHPNNRSVVELIQKK